MWAQGQGGHSVVWGCPTHWLLKNQICVTVEYKAASVAEEMERNQLLKAVEWGKASDRCGLFI